MLVAEAFLDSNETFSGEPFTGCANFTAKLSQACCQVGLRAGGRYFALYLGLPSLAWLSKPLHPPPLPRPTYTPPSQPPTPAPAA